MKTTLFAAIAALALAFAPLANAAEGDREPLPSRAGPAAATHFSNGVADPRPAPRTLTGTTVPSAAAASAAASGYDTTAPADESASILRR